MNELIDIEYLEESFGPSDWKGLKRLLDIAYKTIDIDIDKLKQSHDKIEIQKLAHRLKGTSANIGALMLTQKFEKIEFKPFGKINFEEISGLYKLTKESLASLLSTWSH